MLEPIRSQRIYLRQHQPNPLFEKWLIEWLAYAEQKNSIKKHSLAKALNALRLYPLVLMSGRDCCILDGFGQKICQMLDQRLREHRLGYTVPTDVQLNQRIKTVVRLAQEQMSCDRNASKTRKIDEKRIERLFKKIEDIDAGRPFDESNVKVQPVAVERFIENINSFELILLVDTQEISA